MANYGRGWGDTSTEAINAEADRSAAEHDRMLHFIRVKKERERLAKARDGAQEGEG